LVDFGLLKLHAWIALGYIFFSKNLYTYE